MGDGEAMEAAIKHEGLTPVGGVAVPLEAKGTPLQSSYHFTHVVYAWFGSVYVSCYVLVFSTHFLTLKVRTPD